MRRLAATLAVAVGALLLPATASALTFEVNTLDDEVHIEGCVNSSVECSLRDAIERANATSEPDEIDFSQVIGGTIEVDDPLPFIAWPLTIDATTAGGYAGTPAIALDGSGGSGLEIGETAGGSRVEGLSIGGFYIGIFVYSAAPSYVCGNYVGVAPDGETALPNEYAGISTGGTGALGKGIEIGGGECAQGNLISGNVQFGILEAGEGTLIAGNRIGLDAAGEPLPNGDPFQVSAGIDVNSLTEGVTIGGPAPGEGNLIAYNEGQGVRVRDTASVVAIRGNSIHSNLLAEIQIDAGTKTSVPQLEFVSSGGGASEALGTISGGEPNELYVVDVFANAACEGGEAGGETFLGEVEVETDAAGLGIISSDTLAQAPPGSEQVTATATTASTGTSTFSACYNQPPETELASFPANPTTSGAASFAFTGSDPNGSVTGFLCRLDGSGLAPCVSPVAYSDLALGSHSFEVMAVDAAGRVDVTPPVYTWSVVAPNPPDAPNDPTPPALPGQLLAAAAQLAPQNGETVAVAPVSGKVFVQRPGEKKPTELKEGQTIPVGSIVDATRGRVTLTSVNRAGEAQSAVFYGGRFLVAQQEGSGLVVLKLRGGDLKRCGKAGPSTASASARSGRRLWGSGKGKFRTEGNYGSATVRGTVWLTEDRCDGTFFKVRRGVVAIRDFASGGSFSLGAGKSYLAKP